MVAQCSDGVDTEHAVISSCMTLTFDRLELSQTRLLEVIVGTEFGDQQSAGRTTAFRNTRPLEEEPCNESYKMLLGTTQPTGLALRASTKADERF